jgi:formate-dependent nitrite reductase membrane component NrfD
VVSYDIPRPLTWGWKVSSYIWTKSLAAGAGLVAAALHLAGGDTSGPLLRWIAPALGLVFLALTGALLVADLKRPERFWTILTRPQWKSWLARGAVVITAYAVALGAWAAAAWLRADRALDLLAWPVILLALLTAVYTAFLFAQCEGRDLWQSPLLALHLLVDAPVTALAAFVILAPLAGDVSNVVSWGEAVSAGLVLVVALGLVDAFGPHRTHNATAAARALGRGRQAVLFWIALAVGAALPVTLFLAGPVTWYPLAGALALVGVWMYGHALVMAGQEPRIS